MSADAIWRGFQAAVVHVDLPGGPRRLEPRAPGTVGDFPFRGSVVHIITPYNPDGVLASNATNEQNHGTMAAELPDDLLSFATVGSAPDGSWPEPGFGIVGLTRDEAIVLGRRFGQRAIYEWTAESLTIVGVDEPSSSPTGWALIDVPAAT